MALRTLTIALTVYLLVSVQAAATTGQAGRVAVLNWGLAETLVALGVEPVAVANPDGYRKWVARPELPAGAVDIGRRIQPNLDVLASTRPDLILTSGFYNRAIDRLRTIAPTEILRIYRPGKDALESSLEVAGQLAERLGRQAALERMRARLDTAVARLRDRADPDDSFYLLRFRDSDHVQVFGGSGLFDGVLRRAGLTNAWQGETNYWGFAIAPIDRLDAAADHVVVIEPIPRRAERMMADSPIWQALPAVRNGTVHRLDPIWSFGGVPAATRFAGQLAATLTSAQP